MSEGTPWSNIGTYMANEDAILKMFGFELRRAGAKVSTDKEKLQSIVPPQDQDGSGYVTAAGAHYGQYIDFDKEGDAKDNIQLVKKYRGVSMHPEVDAAIEDIVNEAITTGDNKSVVDLILDNVKAPDSIKAKMREEFDNIVNMIKFNDNGHDIFRN